jgi:CheY-like chemotaxis protein
MGGEVGVDSLPGQGSTFWFTARLGRVQAEPAAPPALAPKAQLALAYRQVAAIRGARVLLVDDNVINLLVARSYLEKMGLVVESVNGGRAALDAVQQSRFDAILMDLHMPDMDGHATARAIRATDPGGKVPIIALTAAVMSEDLLEAQAAGMNGHIAKPVVPLQLASALLQWIPTTPGPGAPWAGVGVRTVTRPAPQRVLP